MDDTDGATTGGGELDSRPVKSGEPAAAGRPAKVLFVHTPKSGGSNLIDYFHHRLGYRRLMSTRTDHQGVWHDFSPDDLAGLVGQPDGFLSTHTLCFGWSELVTAIPACPRPEIISTLRRFRQAGWFSFGFVRHPGELLCSFYHYILDHHRRGNDAAVALHVPAVGVPLDEFIARYCDLPLVPDYWRELDYCAVMSDSTLSDFLRSHFSHQYDANQAWRHASGSRGYEYYCASGQISRDTQDKVDRSTNMAIYRAIEASQRARDVRWSAAGR